tara:strand:- start:2331 stop:2615 length:285 start_codon:yes stop_codon:yes gene_type:complete
MSKFTKLKNEDLPIMLDYSHEWKKEKDADCECDAACYPNSRLACDLCHEMVWETHSQLNKERMEQEERHDERDGHLDDGQMFYNHHEFNDSWQS